MDAFSSKLKALDCLIRRSSPIPDLLARHLACRRRVLPRFQYPPRAGPADLRRRPADAGRVLEAYPVEAAHLAQRHHHLPQPDAAAARRQSARASDCGSLSRFRRSRIFRFRGKHLFNPATFGIIFAIIFLPGTWVSPGQWGQDVAVAGWVVMLGMLVTNRARRGDISWTFLALLSRRDRASHRIPRSAVGRLDASARERRAAAVRVLHDFRSDDRPQRSPRQNRARRSRRRDRIRVASAPLPHQRTHLGFVYRGAMRSAVGRDLARAQIRMDTKWRWPCSFSESRFSFRWR